MMGLSGGRARLPEAEFNRIVNDARSRHNLSEIAARHTDLRKSGARELVGLCPFHRERTPSFAVNDTKGTYHCHGCGAGGDAITLLTKLEGISFMDALEQLAGDAFPVIPPEERAKRKTEADRELADRIAAAVAIWEHAEPPAGTPAEVYARARGITIELPATVRFTRTPRWRDAETGECGRDVPALVCALQDSTDAIVGVQCIFLAGDGSRKYDRPRADGTIGKAKLSFGLVAGSAFRLGPPAEQIVLCEGPEDGLSLAQQVPDRSIWVSCGTAFMPRVEFPAVVSDVILAGDNGDAGRTAAGEARAAFISRGLSVSEVYPAPEFKDWNDELRGIPAT